MNTDLLRPTPLHIAMGLVVLLSVTLGAGVWIEEILAPRLTTAAALEQFEPTSSASESLRVVDRLRSLYAEAWWAAVVVAVVSGGVVLNRQRTQVKGSQSDPQ